MAIYKKYFILFSAVLILLSLMSVKAMSLEPGVKAPQFNIKSGDDKELSLKNLQGKIVVIFYESKDTIEQNRIFKNELAALLDSSEALKARTKVLSVIDCSSASIITRGIWKENLVQSSEREKLIVYGDWDGKVLKDYGMGEDKSNVVVIDRKGIIRFFKAGTLNDSDIKQCKELIKNL